MTKIRGLWIGAVLFAAALIAGFAWHGPIPQTPAYHQFSDQRTLFGIPHFWNVVSNLPFLFVGAAGLRDFARGRAVGIVPALRPAYVLFFVGAVLVGFGSSYYHWNPNNQTLIWDRLPMTISFMAFVAIIVGEYVSVVGGRRLLPVLLVVGAASVAYWGWTESAGRGDLRAYAVVQFVPLLLVPAIMAVYPVRLKPSGYVWALLGFYVLAKVLEALDGPIYAGLGVMSGHALKHVAAAGGVVCFWLALRRRKKDLVSAGKTV